jgi:hypothetical protein
MDGTPIVAAIVGGTIAMLCGRERTRLDNAIIGAIFTASTAYRDPRSQAWETVAVAAVEGAVWGATDRLVPMLKDYLIPPTSPVKA